MTPAHATHTHAVGLRHLCLRLLQIQFRRGEVGSSAMRMNLVAATRIPTFADGIRTARRALRLHARNISCPENAISVANAGRTPPSVARQGASALQNGHTVQRGAAPCISADANLR